MESDEGCYLNPNFTCQVSNVEQVESAGHVDNRVARLGLAMVGELHEFLSCR
jgi:hypothetical protein